MDIDDPQVESSSKKRRHPESSSAPPPKSSSDVLPLIEHPNFDELARWNPTFQRAWDAIRQTQKESHKTFSACVNQEFTVALTRALLKTQLGLELPYLEDDHLCPPVPNRFFYLHWIHTELLPSRNCNTKRMGLDIGSGTTAIYSLLAAKFFHCRMLTTEIDANAAQMAQKNIDANQLSSQIHVAQVPPSHSQDSRQRPGSPLERALAELDHVLQLTPCYHQQQQQQQPTLDFVMTNPPFYDPSVMEYSHHRAGDGRARTAMTVSEGSYPGGEVGFVTEMIADSLRFQGRRNAARWYTSMLGKKTSVVYLQKLVTHILGPAHVRVTEYGPGQYTRWFLAWTLERPSATDREALVEFQDQQDRFTVDISINNDKIFNLTSAAISEVTSRIAAYCDSSPAGWNLTMSRLTGNDATTNSSTAYLQIQEVSPLPVTNFVDESDSHAQQLAIPTLILNALRGHDDNSHFLPLEGHFVIQIAIHVVASCDAKRGDCQVNVHLAAYRHSSRGQAAIKKIVSTIPGDVCRTSRFWRRKLQRDSKNHQH